MTEHLALEGIRSSAGNIGDAYDNALTEMVNGLQKAESISAPGPHRGPYKTITDVEYATAGCVGWYNNRPHSSPGMATLVEYEHTHYTTLTTELESI